MQGYSLWDTSDVLIAINVQVLTKFYINDYTVILYSNIILHILLFSDVAELD